VVLNVLVTGSNGFVGKNLCVALKRRKDLLLSEYDLNNSPEDLRRFLESVDVIYHLAGVNRPEDSSEYETGNAGFVLEICSILAGLNRAPKIIFASSIQVGLDNPYASSKWNAEDALRAFSERTHAACVVYRLNNLFGKWCRPNYNSVTATFCHNIAHGLPITISDPAKQIELTYIDDVVAAFLSELAVGEPGLRLAEPLQSRKTTLGDLAATIRAFHTARTDHHVPDFSDSFIRALYATYCSYLETSNLGYALDVKSDARGSLAEYLKAKSVGQFFISRTHPGVTRGNHYHDSKAEKFLVLQGEAVIRLRHILGNEIVEYRLRGEDYLVVDIPPGYTHSIQNVGSDELVTLFWTDEVFDPQKTDTYPEDP